ncbi:MAG: putative alpha-glucan phosphorylase [Actinomycetia bacterium]|nr:putative alpha-glucan phosphorylase [Actinomycetes bacterium]
MPPMSLPFSFDHSPDIARATERLAAHLPPPLAPLARVAYNYRWSWTPGARETFRAIDPARWERVGGNPVRLLTEADSDAIDRAALDPAMVRQVEALVSIVDADLARPVGGPISRERPAAFMCAEFGVDASLPIYAGGLGVLAGDILKEASDQALAMVGVGLLYRRGYFRQRVDTNGLQHEYWIDVDPDRLPAARVCIDDKPFVVHVPVFGRQVAAQVWRVDVGRVPLLLLDTDLPENEPVDRWITARLYDGDSGIRLAQYAVLGRGGIRALHGLGITPSIVHLNEGHPALALLELTAQRVSAGASFDEAFAETRQQVVFTTHTPVPAGNETYPASQFLGVVADLAADLGIDNRRLLGLGRIDPDDEEEPCGMTALAIRGARSTNGVSARHGEVSRRMWRSLFPSKPDGATPITHVTNGVHAPTWIGTPLRFLLDRYLGDGWTAHASDPSTWAAIDSIPDEELWAMRDELRAQVVELARERSVTDRLTRGETLSYVESAARTFREDVLTIGFARRIATYKRLHLLAYDPERTLRLLGGDQPVQVLLAGKAHPRDDAAKGALQNLFALRNAPEIASRVAFLEDYDIALAQTLVAGCDVWVNVPRPPMEASGTSGMKSVLNGGLQVSVLDGWWAEAWDGSNGWAIDGDTDADELAQDARHANALYELLEHEVVPQFYDRDANGIPRAWIARVKRSLRTLGPRFSATRMVEDYVRDVYKP